MQILLSELRTVCASHPGMYADFIERGKIRGDTLHISRTDFNTLNDIWLPGAQAGTVIHTILKPVIAVAKAIGQDLDNCKGCNQRELKANAATAKRTGEGIRGSQ